MRNKGIAFDLTPLLDVILILMFIILVQGHGQVERAQTAAASSETDRRAIAAALDATRAENEALSSDNDTLRRQMGARNAVLDNSATIAISVETADEGRMLRIETEGQGVRSIPIRWEDRNSAANELRAALTQGVKAAGDQPVYLVFVFDRNEIYQTDYALVRDALQACKSTPHVYTVEVDAAESRSAD